jgi:signal transduction histidine kinase
VASVDNHFEVFFDLVPTGAALYAPVYDEHSELIDFRFARLNLAGQRLLGLPAQPPLTFREYYPNSVPTGIFAQYRRAYLTGQPSTYDVPYAGDGLDTYFRLVAQRSGEMLVVNFTDMADLPHSEVEQSLRESKAREQAAHAEAEAERQRFYDLLMQLPASMATYRGPTHVYELVNRRHQQLFGSRQLLGQPIRQALPEQQGQGIIALLDKVYTTGEPHHEPEQEVWVDTSDTGQAKRRYYNVLLQPVSDAQGRVSGLLNFAYDVTEQVEARQQLSQLNQELEARVQRRTQQALGLQADLLAAAQQQVHARELLYQIFEQTPAAICIQRGPEHRYEYANQAYHDFFPGRPFIGQSVAEALPETVDSGVIALLDRVYQTGETYYGYELPLLIAQPAGPPRQMYFTFTYQALRENGEIVGISTFAYNVAEQVRGRQQREAERLRLERLLLEAPAGIGVLSGPTFVFELVNPLYQQLMPRRQLLGRPLLEAVPELVDSPVPTLLQHVYDTGETHLAQEIQVPIAATEGGEAEERYFTFIYQARRDEQGCVDGILTFVFEVSEQVWARQQVQHLNQALTTANEELQESNRQLKRTNVDLDTFVYTASHDLKAPIINIESILTALRETLPPAAQQDVLVTHLLELLDHTVARFQFTITQLTDISRLQLAHVGPAEPVVLASVVHDVRLDLMPAIAAAGTHLTVAVPAELVVSFSPSNLRSVVYNLLSNAIKYRALDRPSRVHVHATQTAQGIVLMVQDNGLGMSEVQQRQLFGLFQRLHTHVEGTGVGLYISKRLIENAGGTIAVQSQPNAGTVFTVTFPI